MTADADARFVADARKAAPHEPVATWKVRTFGNSAALSDTLVALIASGEKTGTFSAAVEFRDRPAAAPVVGDYFLVTRFDGTPALLYRVTEVETLPFSDIAQRHVDCEAPPLRNVEAWREMHWGYWTPLLQRHGESPRMDMPVVFQRFELVYAAPSLSAPER